MYYVLSMYVLKSWSETKQNIAAVIYLPTYCFFLNAVITAAKENVHRTRSSTHCVRTVYYCTLVSTRMLRIEINFETMNPKFLPKINLLVYAMLLKMEEQGKNRISSQHNIDAIQSLSIKLLYDCTTARRNLHLLHIFQPMAA